MKLVALALIAIVASAQSPEDAQEQRAVAARLGSSEPGEQSWGAYLAANYQQSTFAPSIVELLKSADYRVRLAAFDALIRLKADVPSDALAPLLQEHFDPVLILLARNERRNKVFLLDLLNRRLEDWQWMAVNSVLWADFDASRLLFEQWTIEVEVSVRDQGRPIPRRPIGDTFGWRCEDRPAVAAPGFPPLRVYHVEEFGDVGETLLGSGPHAVYYETRSTPCPFRLARNRNRYRSDFLGSRPPSFVNLEWNGEGQFRSDIENFLKGINAEVKTARSRLSFSDRDAVPDPDLRVRILDQRSDKTVPLPTIDWRF